MRRFALVKEGFPLGESTSKEVRILIPTLSGMVITSVVAFALRRSFLSNLGISQEREFSSLVVLGFAFSLISAVSFVLRKRDTLITILTGTILWVTFVENVEAVGAIRFILFSFVTVFSLGIAERLTGSTRFVFKILVATILTASLCGLSGIVFYLGAGKGGLLSKLQPSLGFLWGLLLGGSVGLGVSLGREVIKWVVKRAKESQAR